MFQKFKNFPVFIVAVFIIAVLGLFLFSIYFDYYSVEAGTADNVTGYAWSDNIGWISFNNTSDGSGIDYGVNIDSASGDLSGYAWSDNIGWVSFNRSDAGNPPAAPFNGGSGPIAKYNVGTSELTGWMRVLAFGGGWDGWIRFCDTSVANCSAANQIARIESNGDWRGWGWSDIVVGWVSFNCLDGGNCAVFDYKVTTNSNQPPTASNFSNPPAMNDLCGTAFASFVWQYNDPDGDSESQFQIQVARDSSFANLLVDRTVPSTALPGQPNSQTVLLAETCSGVCDRIPYGSATYFWRVQVFDAHGAGSGWSPTLSFNNQPVHAWPNANFSGWSPANPSVGEQVTFNAPSQPSGVNATFSWIFVGGTPGSANGSPAITIFNSNGTHNVTLTATDSDHPYSCPVQKDISVGLTLPKWKEVAP